MLCRKKQGYRFPALSFLIFWAAAHPEHFPLGRSPMSEMRRSADRLKSPPLPPSWSNFSPSARPLQLSLRPRRARDDGRRDRPINDQRCNPLKFLACTLPNFALVRGLTLTVPRELQPCPVLFKPE